MDPIALTELLKAGGLLAACAILMTVVAYLYKQNQKGQEQCHSQALEMTKALLEVAKAINGYTIAVDANSRTMEVRAKATDNVAEEVHDMGHKMELLSKEFGSKLDAVANKVGAK